LQKWQTAIVFYGFLIANSNCNSLIYQLLYQLVGICFDGLGDRNSCVRLRTTDRSDVSPVLTHFNH
jgi:hypothetical protein